MSFRLLPARACFYCLCVAPMLVFFLSPEGVSAHSRDIKNTTTGQVTLQMAVGFGGDSRLDYWTPAGITLNNDGPDFRGFLSATTYASRFSTELIAGSILPWSYNEPIVLPHGAQKQVSIYVPFYESPSVPRGIIATLSDNKGRVIATQAAAPFTLDQGSLLVGVLSDETAQGAGFSPLAAVSLPDQTRPIKIAGRERGTMQDRLEMLANFAVIVMEC